MSRPLDEGEVIADALEAMYDLKSTEMEESLPKAMPLYSSLIPEVWRYQDEVLLAQGGVKDVYKAFDPKTNRQVAVAKLHKESPEELFEPFLREARITAFLEHPNIISIYDIGLDENSRPFFTMELKTGHSFDRTIQLEHIKLSEGLSQASLRLLLSLFLRICDAMAYAHSKQVLHLDLKPENIQVGHYGEVILCDWGLGKILGSDDEQSALNTLLLNPDLLNNMTLHGEVKGTPGYIAPELLRGDTSEKTKQADIYALGSILYTLLCSQSPAAQIQSLQELTKKVLSGQIKPLQTYDLKIPSALNSIVVKAMALDLHERYKNVAALAHDINSYLTGYSPTAEKTTLTYELKLFYKRNKIICNLSLTFLIILMTSTSLYFSAIKGKEKTAIQALELLEKEKKEKTLLGRDAAPTYYQKAQQRLKEGDLEQAYKAAELTYLLDAENNPNKNLMGLILFVQGDHLQAQKFLQKPSLPLFEKLKKLNALYLQKNLTSQEEKALIKDLLFYCRWILPDAMTLTLFLHWVDDTQAYKRNFVHDFMKFNLRDTQRILNYAKYECDSVYASFLYERVLAAIKKNKSWLGRRLPATMGSKWALTEKIRNEFTKLIPKNLALGQKVITSGGNERKPELMVDGKLKPHNYWAASPQPAHATVDLVGLHPITKIKVFFRYNQDPSTRRYEYNIYTSIDGINFHKIVDQSKNKELSREAAFVHDIEPFMARYVRIEVLFNPVDNGVHVRELEVYSNQEAND